MKKAYLVTIEACTRVVVDVKEGMSEDEIQEIAISQATGKILSNPDGYILDENCSNVIVDDECPAGTFSDD